MEQDIAVLGISVTDVVTISPPAGFVPGVLVSGHIKANGVVTIRCVNATSTAITPAKGAWTIRVIKEVR